MLELMMWAHLTTQVAEAWDKYRLNDSQKAWFSRQRSAVNGACCDTADGLPVDDWELRQGADGRSHYWFLFRGEWLAVPDVAVLHDGNPVGVPVVWFMGPKNVRCFAPGAEN